MLIKHLILISLISFSFAIAEEGMAQPEIGIDDTFLGEKVDLDLSFFDENGEPITLAAASEGRPTILALVYYNCTSICNPFLNAIVDVVNQSPQAFLPGDKYNIVAVSFDPKEDHEIAALKKQSYFNLFQGKTNIPESSFRFLTADSATIRTLTESVGFKYAPDEEDGFMHASSLIVLSPSGIISRYIRGLSFLPVEVMISVTNAMEGKWAPTVKKIVKFCFAEEPEGRGYYFNFLKVTGVIILFSILFTVVILSVLLNKKKKPPELETKGA
ncbi:MAG: SCO family protein [FCB group bacterium]|nr:SCO family protein [FCB group bacterium]MBL7027305.1 SCO family protein [Candidatus Neomarinimicrobiota bacterium]MBL7122275.1 SCO family protein [Candidatus Neomarinimicrobiota bacterium]